MEQSSVMNILKNNATRLKVSLNNLYSCKYSSKRDRFYIYIEAVEKRKVNIY